VRITVRRVARHPVIRRGLRSSDLLKKHVVRGATLGLVPSTVNDVAFHHAPLDVGEVIHVVQDAATISTLTLVMATLMVATRFRLSPDGISQGQDN
jgi:hypothetical protein